MSALGSLVVKLGLEYAEFTGGLDKSEQAALAHAKRVQDTFDGIKDKVFSVGGAIAGGLAAAFTVSAFKSLLSDAVATGAALDDLAMQTGATVEALSGLAEVGKFNDMGPEKIGAAMNMLTRNLAGATEESKGTGAAIKALGLDMGAFRAMKPEEQMQAIAKALDGVQDGAGKSAVMMALYGKEGAQMLPFMKDLASVGELQAKVTAEQAAAAAQLDDNWVKLTTTGGETAKEVAMGMVPAFDDAVRAIMDVMSGTGGLRETLRGLVADGTIKRWTTDAIKGLSYVADAGEVAWRVLQSTGKGLGGLAAALVQALQGDFRGAWDTLKASGQDMVDVFDGPTIGARFRESLDKVAATTEVAGETAKKTAIDFRNLATSTKPGELDKLASSGADLAASLQAVDSGLSGDFVKKWDSLNAAYRADKISLDELTAAQARLLEQQPAMKKASEDAIKASQAVAAARTKEADGIAAFLRAQSEAAAASLQSVQDRVADLKDEERAAALAAAQNVSLAEAVEMVAIARLQEKQAGFYDGSEGWQALQQEIAARRELLGLIGGKSAREATKKAADEAQNELKRVTDQYEQGLTNAAMQGGKSLKEYITGMLRTTAFRIALQPIMAPLAGLLAGTVGSSAAAGQGGAAGGLGGLLNAGSSIYSALTNGISGSISSAFSNFAASGVGQSLGLSAMGAGGMGPPALTSMGSTVGAGLGMLGSGFAGYGLSKMISGGYTTGGNTVNALAGVASAFLGPLAGVAGGLINRAFGRKLKDVGIEGTLGGAEGFEGQAYQFYKGGWLRSDKTKYRELDTETAGALANSFKAIQAEVGTFATVLGLETDKIASFTTSLKVSTKGLDEAGIQQAFQDALAKGSNELAQQVLGTWTSVTREVTDTIQSGHWDSGYITEDVTRTVTESTYAASEYAKAGEDAIDTLRRLATSISAVNAMSDAMGQDLQLSGLAGAAAASKIVEAFGGLEAYAQTMGSYFQNYYSDAEQRAAVARQASRALADVGLDFSADKLLAATRPQIRAFVDGVAEQFGQDSAQYVAAVQQANALSAILAPLQSAVRTASTAMDDLERAVSAEREALRARLDAAQDIANTLEGVFDVLHSNVRELYGEVGDTRAMLAQQGGDFITAALATAKKSGYLPDQDQLAEAIGAVRAGLADGFDVDSAERDYATKVLAGQLSEMEKIAGKQLTDAQRTVKELETHTGQLDQTLEYWRRQISLAEGTQDATLSVAEAVGRLQDFLGSGGTGTGGTGTGTGKPSGGGGGGGAGGITAGSDYQRVGYGADEALGSFDKFSAWYQGLRSTANVGAMTDGGYKRPDWMRVAGMAADGTDKELFAQYQFFKNNPQYAKDYEQIMTSGRSSYSTDGSTLVRSDLSKMPDDVAAYYRNNTSELLSAEGFGLDPVLAYQLYRDGPERFGLDRRTTSFTEWLRTNQWTAEGLVAGNNMDKYAGMDYAAYNLTKWDTATGTLVGRDGIIYTPDGKPVGKASASQMQELYGNSNSRLYNQTTSGGTSAQDYYTGLRQKYDQDIADGKSAQYLADSIRNSGASMQDIATAYGISVDVLKENLRLGGATDIPQFAGGGYHAGGLRIVGEEGWEVEATGPSRIWNQRQLAQALTGGGSNAQLEALVQSLMAEIKLLRQSVDRGSDHAGDTAAALREVKNGNSLIVEMAPSALS